MSSKRTQSKREESKRNKKARKKNDKEQENLEVQIENTNKEFQRILTPRFVFFSLYYY